jgi:hypothetical protein
VNVDPVLRAKYLDYCSAQISEVFLSLTDERTYQLMEEAAHEANLAVGALSFQAMMQLVTRKLRKSVPLPDLETWIAEYTEDPGRKKRIGTGSRGRRGERVGKNQRRPAPAPDLGHGDPGV